jgi:LysR family transcriptional activator of nhaA
MPKRLNFGHLRYFWTVAKQGHLTRAAQQLHVSQSALSSQIRRLEEQLGGDLFLRTGRSLQLTELGRVVLDYAEAIFSLGNELQAVVAGGAGRPGQTLRIGSVATLSRNFQENFLHPVLAMDEVRLELRSGGLDELLARLKLHKLDLVLSNTPVAAEPGASWSCRRIARQTVCLVGQPRLSATPFRFPADLRGQRLLLPGQSSDIRAQFDLLCEEHGAQYLLFAEVDDMAMLRLLARDSRCIAVLPEVVVQDELSSGRLVKYCELPGLFENFYAITAQRQFQSQALRALLDGKPGDDVATPSESLKSTAPCPDRV